MKQHVPENLSSLIARRLEDCLPEAQRQFSNPPEGLTRFTVIDDLLPSGVARAIFDAFPKPEQMRFMKTFREMKYTTKKLGDLAPIMHEITFAFQTPEVIAIVEKITGMKRQHPDPNLYAGGLSLMKKDHFLSPHLDNSHDGHRVFYRTLNLLYYVSPDWNVENGGNLELWNADVSQKVTLPSLFNRLILMETNKLSWHSVSRLDCDQMRTCVSNYYFSPDPPGHEHYFHITSFAAPPENGLLRLWSKVDNGLRGAIRWIVPTGVGKRDVYKPEKK